MALWGTLVNALAIIIGSLLGLVLPRLREGIKTTVMQGIGLSLCVLGITMALKSSNFLLVVGSLVIGGVAGELLKVERGLESIGARLERFVHAIARTLRRGKGPEREGKLAAGFVNATLIYCVGAMAILGSLDSGIRHQHDILYTKAMLDGFLSVILASTLGVGVLFSSAPVFLYQGAIALSATGVALLMNETMLNDIIAQVTAVGGILIIGIGINLLEIKKISIANLLPSVLVAALAVPLLKWIGAAFGLG